MKKIIVIILCVMLVGILLGCTTPIEDNNAPDTNTPNGGVVVNSQAEADSTLDDIGTDISGISDSLDGIDNTLIE